VFLLLGPTGTGKTRTVEALAEVLHGSRKNLLRIDCGEYQMDHEVAKLIGAPPGYLGHRETQPVLSQAKLAAVTSSHSSLSIVLFDEIEKAAPSLTRLLLGVLDKAALRLGDNNVVNFERSLVFLTSNVGARGIQCALSGGIGFVRRGVEADDNAGSKLHQIALQAARRDFSPEFLNRVDATVTYQPLSEDALKRILDLHLSELQDHIERRLGTRAFRVNVTKRGRDFLLQRGTSAEYGAREIRRAVQKYVAHPVSLLLAAERVPPGATVRVDVPETETGLSARAA
jgi:ATP-dependent Clp protease ATP-binding subunit ClpA